MAINFHGMKNNNNNNNNNGIVDLTSLESQFVCFALTIFSFFHFFFLLIVIYILIIDVVVVVYISQFVYCCNINKLNDNMTEI